MEQDNNIYERKINYYETDKMGVVHHSNYIRYLEEARCYFLKKMKMPFEEFEKRGITIPVLAVNCEYKHHVTFADTIYIKVIIKEYNGVRLTIGYEFKDKKTGKEVIIAETKHCFTNKDLRPVNLAKYCPEYAEIFKQLKQLKYNEKELDTKIEENIDFAKRHLVDTIYKQAILEGVATTFADTESIIEGGKVNNMTAEDVMKIVNLKHAWEFILNKNVILSSTNFALLCEINKMVEEGFYYTAGKIRNVPVTIGGTKWIPELPIESMIKEELEEILNNDINDVDKAIELLLYTMKRQIFIDGNKRTSVIFTNHYLISKGKGIIVIPAELTEQFKNLLIPYYEGKDEREIKKFIKEKCYMGI